MKNQDLIDTAQEATIRFGAATLERIADEDQRKRAAAALHTAGNRASEVAHDLGERASEVAHELGERVNERIGDRGQDATDHLADVATTASSAVRTAAATAGGLVPNPASIATTAAAIWASPRGRKVAIGAGIGIAAGAAITLYRRRKAASEQAEVNQELSDSTHGVAGWNTPAEAFAGLDSTASDTTTSDTTTSDSTSTGSSTPDS